jgi:hypothetical protein
MKLLFIIFIFFGFSAQGQQMYHAHNQVANNLLLDLYPNAEAAYSIRLLRTAYTGHCMRVRRSSDNTEQDIGFLASGHLDTTSLKSFVSSNSAYVVIWYDQSTNGRDAGMSSTVTSAKQPRIINAGVIERQGSNPSIRFDGTDDRLDLSGADTINTVNKDWAQFYVQKRRVAGKSGAMFTGGTAGNAVATQFFDNNFTIVSVPAMGTNGGKYRTVADATSTFTLIEGHNVSNTMSAYKNNTAYSLGSVLSLTITQSYINSIGSYGGFLTDGHISEIIHWNTAQTGNRSSIASNINSYYSIY